MSTHAKYSPSATKRWMNCYGFIRLKDQYENKSSDYAKDGTAAHKLLELCLMKNEDAQEYIGETLEEVKVTPKMADAVQVAVSIIRGDKQFSENILLTETRVVIVPDLCEGTTDVALIDPNGKLILYDYKHGAGVPVSAFENEQLLTYAVGFVEKYPIEDVELVIIQPNTRIPDEVITRWNCGLERVLQHKEAIIKAIAECEKKDAKCTTGAWCKFCPVLNCPAATQAVKETTKSSIVKMPEKEILKSEDLKRVLDNKKLIEGWLEDIETYAKDFMLKGGVIEGYEVVDSLSNRKWKDETEVEKIFGEEAFIIERKLLSPTQFEKKVDPVHKDKLESLITREVTGQKIAKTKTKKEK